MREPKFVYLQQCCPSSARAYQLYKTLHQLNQAPNTSSTTRNPCGILQPGSSMWPAAVPLGLFAEMSFMWITDGIWLNHNMERFWCGKMHPATCSIQRLLRQPQARSSENWTEDPQAVCYRFKTSKMVMVFWVSSQQLILENYHKFMVYSTMVIVAVYKKHTHHSIPILGDGHATINTGDHAGMTMTH